MRRYLLLFSVVFVNMLSSQKLKMKDYTNILKSNNIYEINAFLRDAHPDDPKRSVLKPKVMKMMKDYIAKAHPADQRVKDMQEMLAMLKKRPSTKISFEEMNAIIKQKQIAKYKAEMELANKRIAESKKSGNVLNSTSSQNATSMQNTSSAAAVIANTAENPEAEEFNLLMNESPIDHKMKTAKILTSLFDNDPMSKECIVMVKNNSDCNIIMRIEGAGNLKYRLAVPVKDEASVVIQKGDYLFTSLVCGAQYASQKTIQKALLVSLGNPSPNAAATN